MELQRGVCSLCLENGKVFTPSDVEAISKFLPRILYDNFLSEAEFQKIKDSVKICAICCVKVQAAEETRKAIKNAASLSEPPRKSCHFCHNDEFVIKVKDDWKFFILRTEGFLKLTDFPVRVCSRCVFYFDTIFNIKKKLTYKFPQLAVSTKTRSPQIQNDTPKRKSLSKSPPSSKKRKIFDNCFTYLQPLCNNNYHVDDDLKSDSRLYKKIAYVNMRDVKSVKETPKVRPIIKIKLKAKSEKGHKEKLTPAKIPNKYVERRGFKTRPYIRLSKSEEVSGEQKSKPRRYSCHIEERGETEENLDETPKAASAANLVPKRRVSLFMDNDGESEEKSDTQNSTEDINKIVEKYIQDSTFDDNNKLDLLEEIGEDKVEGPVEENGIEKGTEIVNEEREQNDSNNGDKSEEDEGGNEKNLDGGGSENSLSNEAERKTPSKSDSSSESSDSDSSEKLKSKDTTDRDSLNGSERKKKRVTFSDEIN